MPSLYLMLLCPSSPPINGHVAPLCIPQKIWNPLRANGPLPHRNDTCPLSLGERARVRGNSFVASAAQTGGTGCQSQYLPASYSCRQFIAQCRGAASLRAIPGEPGRLPPLASGEPTTMEPLPALATLAVQKRL